MGFGATLSIADSQCIDLGFLFANLKSTNH
jgi:hypothetical protein